MRRHSSGAPAYRDIVSGCLTEVRWSAPVRSRLSGAAAGRLGAAHTRRSAAAAARTGPSGTWCPAVKPAHVWSGAEAGRTEAGERPASFVCRGVTRVYRPGRGDGSGSTTEGPGVTRRPSADGTRRRTAVGFKRRQVQREGSRGAATGRLGRRTAPASPARPSSSLKGECHGTTLREVPRAGLRPDGTASSLGRRAAVAWLPG